jgi:long-chain acyl-CoA synthetase
MFGERWKNILNQKGEQTALWHPGGALTFLEIDQLARGLQPQNCPRLGAFFLAQGDGVTVTLALLAGFLSGLPVQVVEMDRQRRVPLSVPEAPVSLIKQTVGSSGVRRCQFFTLAQIAADVDRLHQTLELHRHEAALAPLSVAHSFGLTTTVLQTLFNGLPTHWLPTPFPAGMNEALSRHQQVFLPGVPAMWKAWLIAALDLSCVSLAVTAGSPLTLSLEQQARDTFGFKLHNLYGTSECGAISYDATLAPRSSAADIGTLLPGIAIRQEQDGRLRVLSDAAGLGYDEVLPGDVLGSSEHLTWDVITEVAGRLHFQSCVGDGINVASRKLSPTEIAARIREATGIREVTISGVPSRDPERTQDVVCAIMLPQDQLTQAFKSSACAALAPWEVPRKWVSLPQPGA